MSRGTKIGARQFLSFSCLATTPTAGVFLKEEKCTLLWARDSLGGILGDDLGEGNCESKTVSRHRGDNFCRETSRCLAGPSGLPTYCRLKCLCKEVVGQKNQAPVIFLPVVLGAGHGCANFMDAGHFLVLSAGKHPMPIKCLALGGRGCVFFLEGGGGSANLFCGGKLFYLQLELFCLQLSFVAYSPSRPLVDALSYCKQKSSNCK